MHDFIEIFLGEGAFVRPLIYNGKKKDAKVKVMLIGIIAIESKYLHSERARCMLLLDLSDEVKLSI